MMRLKSQKRNRRPQSDLGCTQTCRNLDDCDCTLGVWMGLLSKAPLNLMPDLSYPTITIRTAADGYAPEEVESQVSQRIEEAVATTPGLSKLESRSKANGSDVILSFNWGTDMDPAIQNVREQLQVNPLPDDVDRPLILRYDPTLDPIIRIALSKPISGSKEGTLADLRQIAERLIKKDLEAMDGVAAVRIRGFEAETQVLVREDWLQARNVTIEQVIQTLQAENVNIPWRFNPRRSAGILGTYPERLSNGG